MVFAGADTLSHGAMPCLDSGAEGTTMFVDLAGPVRNG
jgi:hypothetical protein